ncbi:LysM repeat protein [Aequitasia blattaphilus]|uniref:LysM peptidoglycan-binding domain-containing protein n=1 Tax=Aequitasia blattaphilus TaxID=2949332 RepID=A0ABT1E7C2_9FIRM|nr:LysM peptidoglycan-binding domain-containing protein [Aequitasia blattaphilus]MCP1101714.1 LysM peptidoglycan-binding domain-containing protein [Aequitasia blattaphilus]MCR8614354.1 LysM peptidoglycan-binding domain-containing protein [Aequitasia blattaphilus]
MKSKKRKREMYIKKFTAVVISLALVGTLNIVYGSQITAKGSENALKKYYKSVEIEAGDTLWDLAQKHKGDADIRDYINEIKQLNQLDSDTIHYENYLTVSYYGE